MINVDRSPGVSLVTDGISLAPFLWQVSFSDGKSVYVRAYGHISAIQNAMDACYKFSSASVVLVKRIENP